MDRGDAFLVGVFVGCLAIAIVVLTTINTESGIKTFYTKVHRHQIVLDNDGFYKTYSAVRVHGK